MTDLSTTYLGLSLKSPLVASSSGLTASIDDLKKFEANGVGAVVLKSIFEEEIIEYTKDAFLRMQSSANIYPEAIEYIESGYDELKDPLHDYLSLIKQAKKELNIPVIASINCVTAGGWIDFAEKIEHAGADAIELNVFLLPSDLSKSCTENDGTYFEIASNILKHVTIPISLKIGYYSSNLAMLIQMLSETGIKGITLFNRTYSRDFNIDTLELTNANVLSNPAEIAISLRWIALMADMVKCDLAASTGVHSGAGIVKEILAGAKVVEVASAFYIHGIDYASTMLEELRMWMDENEYQTLNDFRGRMSKERAYNPAAYERVQFMKYFKDR